MLHFVNLNLVKFRYSRYYMLQHYSREQNCYLESIKFSRVSGICLELIFHKKRVYRNLRTYEKQFFLLVQKLALREFN